jgi:hypothetical protein
MADQCSANSMGQRSFWEANRSSASQDIPAFYKIRIFITLFTTERHLSLSCARSIQSMPPQPTSWRSILPPTPGFSHQNLVKTSLLPHTCYIYCPSLSSWFTSHLHHILTLHEALLYLALLRGSRCKHRPHLAECLWSSKTNTLFWIETQGHPLCLSSTWQSSIVSSPIPSAGDK